MPVEQYNPLDYANLTKNCVRGSPMNRPEYDRLDAINWSTLKAMADSPLHYRHAVDHGREDTDAFAFGRLADVLIFTPDVFDSTYVISPFDDFRTKAAKEWRAEQEVRGVEVVKSDTLDQASALAEAVRRHPDVRPLLDAGEAQTLLSWTDHATGLRCKGITDLLCRTGRAFLVDGKSTRTVDKRRYLRQASSLLYHGQLAHYRAGMRAWGVDPEFVGHIVYEKAAPFDVAVFEFAPAVIDAGEALVRDLLDRVAECRASGRWPGRYDGVEPVTINDYPLWDYTDDDSAEDLGLSPT